MIGYSRKQKFGTGQMEYHMNEEIIIDKDQFERRKVSQLVQKYEYGSITYDQLLNSLVYMGWDRTTMDKVLKECYSIQES